jgi:ribose transport system ATP-binding protein
MRENITLPTISTYLRRGLLRERDERRDVLGLMDRFRVHPKQPERLFATFSGGNQQKALVAKWFATQPKVLLLHEPTHGVDVGARQQIFRHIRDGTDRGMGILISSVDYEDLAHLCDRVIVFRHGAASAELRGPELTKERILERCYGPAAATGRGPG